MLACISVHEVPAEKFTFLTFPTCVPMTDMKYELKMDQRKAPHVADNEVRRGGPAGPPSKTSFFNPRHAFGQPLSNKRPAEYSLLTAV